MSVFRDGHVFEYYRLKRMNNFFTTEQTCGLHGSGEVVLHGSGLAESQLGEGEVTAAVRCGPAMGTLFI
jgi:hypothetical protein